MSSAGPPRSCQSLEVRPFLSSAAATETPREVLLEGLRARIRTLEGHAEIRAGGPSPEPWSLGAAALDARLAPAGLDPQSLHEIKPAAVTAGARATALAFTLRLAARRMKQVQTKPGQRPPRILWCWPARWRSETGDLYGPGLEHLGLDPRSFLIVEPGRKTEALWALEEGLKSASLALAIGLVDDIALTPARRLALAAAEGATPCLLMTAPEAPGSGATATRWRIGPAPSAPHPFDEKAPGGSISRVALERSRGAKPGPETSHILEWSDETHTFRMAPDVAHRAPLASYAWRRTG